MMFEYERLLYSRIPEMIGPNLYWTTREIFMWDSNVTFNTIHILSMELS